MWKKILVFSLSFSIVFLFYMCCSLDSLVYVDGKFCRNCWNDIVLTLHFSRWHLLQTPEARDLCLPWLWRGQWWLPQCCFMTPRPWISHTSLCSICHSSNADNISIPQEFQCAHYRFLRPTSHDVQRCVSKSGCVEKGRYVKYVI